MPKLGIEMFLACCLYFLGLYAISQAEVSTKTKFAFIWGASSIGLAASFVR